MKSGLQPHMARGENARKEPQCRADFHGFGRRQSKRILAFATLTIDIRPYRRLKGLLKKMAKVSFMIVQGQEADTNRLGGAETRRET